MKKPLVRNSPVRRVNRSLLPAMLLLGLLGFAYFQLVALPVLSGTSDVVAVVGDSISYHGIAESGDFPLGVVLGALIGGTFSVGYFSQFGITAFGFLLAQLFGKAYTYAVFLGNLVLLYASLRNLRSVYFACRPTGTHFHWFILAVLVNPAILVNLASLNKEILGVFFLSAFLRYAFFSRMVPYFFFAFLALVFRDAYFVVAIVFWLMTRLRIRPLAYLIAAAAVVAPFVASNVGEVAQTGEALGARSASFLNVLLSIESIPLGYLVTYPVKVALQFFAATLPHRYVEISFSDPYGTAITLSSGLFLVVCSFVVFRTFSRRRALNETVFRLAFAYTIVFCLVPYSVHRLFVPLYPVIVALLFIPPIKSAWTARRSARAGRNARPPGRASASMGAA